MSDFLAFARRHVVLLDGAMGSQLQARDLTLDDCTGIAEAVGEELKS